jgi:DNA polymerase-3 subunit alpha
MPAGALNRRVLECLVASGACDALGERSRLFAGAALALDHAAATHRDALSGQSSLFGGEETGGVAVAPPLPEAPAWTARERGMREKELLGFYLSGHPLDPIREDLPKVATHTIADVLEAEDGADVRIAGLLGEVKTIQTRTGKAMAILTVEDLSGRIECTLFPEAYTTARPLLEPDSVLVLSGRVEVREERGTKVLVSDVCTWEQACLRHRPSLHLELRAEDLTEQGLRDLDEVLSAHPGDIEVVLHIVKPDHSRLALRSKRFRVGEGRAVAAGLAERVPACRVSWQRGNA